jgi:hypothetical protein
MYAVDAPWRINIATIALSPTEQIFGGMEISPAPEQSINYCFTVIYHNQHSSQFFG